MILECFITADIPCAEAFEETCEMKCANIDGKDTCVCPSGQELGDDGKTCVGKLTCRVFWMILKLKKNAGKSGEVLVHFYIGHNVIQPCLSWFVR